VVVDTEDTHHDSANPERDQFRERCGNGGLNLGALLRTARQLETATSLFARSLIPTSPQRWLPTDVSPLTVNPRPLSDTRILKV